MRPNLAIVLSTASFKVAGSLTSAGAAMHSWPVASDSSFAAWVSRSTLQLKLSALGGTFYQNWTHLRPTIAALAPWRICSKVMHKPSTVFGSRVWPLSLSFHDICLILHLYRKELFPWKYLAWKSMLIPRSVLHVGKTTLVRELHKL